ncbi:CinA family protein [Aureimonas sp. Leaf324]|jgi:nicotinamide-nucleotide amidase|uniref:CinA family protein n=1 Tax=Aureimonas sp. Leaf324 TaxID=1736336 RepID=UPI0006FA78FC|nr:CinA family protein [Aureimonas sp. Leaf324]KQQ89880.1 damage-inducible protein CinA [Aureimonas sp. Leaf324]
MAGESENRDRSGAIARRVVEKALAQSLTIATAESCTGGLVSAAITDIAGSSAVFGTGFVTYSNAAKARLLKVPTDRLERFGAVSREVAEAMAEGARSEAGCDIAVSITGIAGPGGGTDLKPVGLVHFACASKLGTVHVERRFGALGRSAVREASAATALELVEEALDRLSHAEAG